MNCRGFPRIDEGGGEGLSQCARTSFGIFQVALIEIHKEDRIRNALSLLRLTLEVAQKFGAVRDVIGLAFEQLGT